MAIATKNKKRHPKKSSSTQAQKRVICSKRGCNNKARTRGLCERHCANRPNCKVEGCTTRAQNGCEGLCKRHRAIAKSGSDRPTCNIEGCKYWAQEGGICQKHGGKRVNPVKECSIGGCSKFAQSGCRKMCRRHHSISKSGNSVDELPITSEKKQSQHIGAAVSSKYGKKRARSRNSSTSANIISSDIVSGTVSVNNTLIEIGTTGTEDSRSKRLRRWLNSWIF